MTPIKIETPDATMNAIAVCVHSSCMAVINDIGINGPKASEHSRWVVALSHLTRVAGVREEMMRHIQYHAAGDVFAIETILRVCDVAYDEEVKKIDLHKSTATELIDRIRKT